MTAILSALAKENPRTDEVLGAAREPAEGFRIGDGLNWAARTGFW